MGIVIYNDKQYPMLVKVRDLTYNPSRPDDHDFWLQKGEVRVFDIEMPIDHIPWIKMWNDRDKVAVTLLSYMPISSIKQNTSPASRPTGEDESAAKKGKT